MYKSFQWIFIFYVTVLDYIWWQAGGDAVVLVAAGLIGACCL